MKKSSVEESNVKEKEKLNRDRKFMLVFTILGIALIIAFYIYLTSLSGRLF